MSNVIDDLADEYMNLTTDCYGHRAFIWSIIDLFIVLPLRLISLAIDCLFKECDSV